MSTTPLPLLFVLTGYLSLTMMAVLRRGGGVLMISCCKVPVLLLGDCNVTRSGGLIGLLDLSG